MSNTAVITPQIGDVLLSEEEIRSLQSPVQREFPDDMALQEVHLDRQILSKEAERYEIPYLQYIKILARQLKT